MIKKIDTGKAERPLRLVVASVLAVGLCAPMLVGSTALAASSDSGTKSTTKTASTGRMVAERNFLNTATTISERDIEAAQLAQQRATNAKVRDLAGKLVRDHQALLTKLDDTTVALGLGSSRTSGAATAMGGTTTGGTTASTTGTTGRTEAGASAMRSEVGSGKWGEEGKYDKSRTGGTPEVQALAERSGAEFDREFLDRVVADHEHSVAAFNQAAIDPALSSRVRTLASQNLPILRANLATARTLRASIDKPAM